MVAGSLDAVRTETQRQGAELQKHEVNLGTAHKAFFEINLDLAELKLNVAVAGPARGDTAYTAACSPPPEVPTVASGKVRGPCRGSATSFAGS